MDGIGATDLLPTFAALAKARLPDAVLDGVDWANAARAGAKPAPVMPYFYRGRLQARAKNGRSTSTTSPGANRRRACKSAWLSQRCTTWGGIPGKFDKAASEPAILQRLQQDAQAFERSITKAAPEFDRVTIERGMAGRGGN